MKPSKLYSLVFCRRLGPGDSKEVLLGLKKRGFGCGKVNGYGGKAEEGETISQCAIRELEEESSLRAQKLEHVASLEFDMPAQLMRVEVFTVSSFEGEAVETEEMSPQWVDESELPALFQQGRTWADDQFWLPQVLASADREGRLCARFRYSADNETIESYSIFTVPL